MRTRRQAPEGQQRPALADVLDVVDEHRAAERLAARRSGVMPPSARGVQVVERGEVLTLGIPDEWGGCEVALAPHAWIEVLEQSWARWRQFSAPRIELEGPQA